MEETWKPIVGFEGMYEVSSYGNVKSTKFKKIKKMTPQNNGNGYFAVHLRKPGLNKYFYLHRLVAQTFIENPHNKRCVNHIDNNRSNNIASNLEWCTNKENTAHMIRQERNLFGEKSHCSKLLETDVLIIRGSKIHSKVIAKEYSISREQVDRIKRKASWGWL